MKTTKILVVAVALLSLSACGDKMDYNEYNYYDKDYISKTFSSIGGFMTDIYNTVDPISVSEP